MPRTALPTWGPNLDSVPPPTPELGPLPNELPSEPPSEPRPDREILGRHRPLQLISVALITIGILIPAAVLLTNPKILSAGGQPEAIERLLGPLLLLGLGGLLLITGLLANAVRSVIVRADLAPARYRGPAIIVLLLLAIVAGTVISLGAGGTVLALFDGGPLSVGGTLLLLTSTQMGLLIVQGALVVAPHALSGLRLSAPGGLGRGMLVGAAAAVPAWVVATLLAWVATSLLTGAGLKSDAGILETVLDRGDPTVIIVAFVIVAPMAEELFFRGLVYNAWERERGPRVALFGSAALFAAIHGSLFSLVPIFALGVALATVYRTTRSLPAAMAMHATFNAISVAIAFLARQGIVSLPT